MSWGKSKTGELLKEKKQWAGIKNSERKRQEGRTAKSERKEKVRKKTVGVM